MIPKIVHYVWLGDGEEPESVRQYIAGWRNLLSGYEFRRWGNAEANELAAEYPYLAEALVAKKWAFASDVLRLHALMTCGGVYLDTDIEVRASFDEFLENDFFCSSEVYGSHASPVSTAVIGSVADGRVVRVLLDDYKNRHFIVDGVPDCTTNVDRTAIVLKRELGFNWQPVPAQAQMILPGSLVYPADWFCNGRYAVHHFSATWSVGRTWLYKGRMALLNGWYIYRFKQLVKSGTNPELFGYDVVCPLLSLSKTRHYFLVHRQ